MIHIQAPSGLLVWNKPFPGGPSGVGWTSDPREARLFTDTGDARWWAKQNAPALYPGIVTSLGREYQYGDLRFPIVEGRLDGATLRDALALELQHLGELQRAMFDAQEAHRRQTEKVSHLSAAIRALEEEPE